MKKTKRCLALLIAMVMTATVCIGNGPVTAFADETETAEGSVTEESESNTEKSGDKSQLEEADNKEENNEANEDVEEKETRNADCSEGDNTESPLDMKAIEEAAGLFEQLPAAPEVEDMSEEEFNETMQQVTDAINAFDGLGTEECDYFIENYPDLYKAVMEDLSNALAKTQQGEISTNSLLPLEEVEAYLILSGYTKEELANMSIDRILDMLENSDGKSIEIKPGNATKAWLYFEDTDSGVEEYTEYALGKNEVVDLSQYYNSGEKTFQLEIIVGNKGQLNEQNIRYIVTVHLSDEIEIDINDLTPCVYAEYSGIGREYIAPGSLDRSVNDEYIYNVPTGTYKSLWSFGYALEEVVTCNRALLFFDSEAIKDPRVSVKVEDCSDNFADVTDKIVSHDKENADTGYEFKNEVNMFYVTYYMGEDILKEAYVAILVSGGYLKCEAAMNSIADGEKTDVVYNMTETESDVTTDENGVIVGTRTNYTFELKQGFDADDDYNLNLTVFGGRGAEDNCNGYIQKAVEGYYTSIDEVSELPDIKEELFDDGYRQNYGGDGIGITLFFGNDYPGPHKFWQFSIKNIDYSEEWREYTETPIIGASDPWFRVTGANDNEGNVYDTYIIENGKNINIDTMYGYGYQTVFINEDTDSFVPTFWKADDEAISIDRIYANGREFQEGSELSFPEGENTLDATFSVIITDKNGSHTKNYDITFVKKASGPQLYVAGPLAPDVRSVFLDEYHEYKHDIFIANIGDEPLTDLWLDLDATNVELDDYWTIGGDGNNTLEACPDDFAEELESTDYGELSNVAKIRLIPPSTGKGEIEGTLKIYSGKEGDAANSELLATIILSDLAQNPEIETTEVDDAVKYVPYSYLITTDNMYDWVNVSYELTSGSLPDGVELIEETGELYGVPQETGSFTFTVSTYFESTSENYAFDSSEVELTLTVNENTDDNVFNATDASDNYSILDAIGTEATPGDHHYILEDYSDGQMFRSEGEFDQFVDVWLNGEKLERDVDYTAEEGSTRITISAQTFENKANKNGERNTIAAEYRTKDPDSKNDSDNGNKLKKTSQNFYIHTHSYNGEVTTEPTCTETGVKTYTCSCGSKYTETIPALGHTAGEGEITQKLTCTQDGETSYYCTRCGVLMETKVTPATGHDYEITVTPGKDCATEGIRTGVCRKCGDTYTERIPATGHKYLAEVTTEPTETEDGLRTYTCSVCGDSFTEVIPALGDGTHLHTYDEGVVTKEATCLENGMMTYTCTQCGAIKQETILASGHKFTEEIIEEVTCMEPGLKKLTCEYCGAAYMERIPATGHKYDDGVVTKEPTDTETGIRTYTCTVCGNSYTEVIPMLNSDLARKEAGNNENVNGANADEKSDSVKTGDKTSVAFWMCMMGMASAAAAIGMTMRRRKK